MRTQLARPYSQSPENRLSSAEGSRRSSFHDPCKIVGIFRPLEAVAPAIDQLLDAEQHDQRARNWHARRIRREWNQRGCSKAAEIVDEVLDAEHQHRQGDQQDDRTIKYFHEGALGTAQALGD